MSCSEEETRSVVVSNGSITAAQELTIDHNLLIDPKLLFIGSKIGEGAHGKVYEGRSVSNASVYNQLIYSIMFSDPIFFKKKKRKRKIAIVDSSLVVEILCFL